MSTPKTDQAPVITKEITVEGKKFQIGVIVGDIDVKITELKPTEPGPIDPKPEPEVDPTTGTIKEGSRWADPKNPGQIDLWTVVEMTDADKKGLFKIINGDKLNIIADIESKEIGEKLIEYFRTHPFPPTSNGGGGDNGEPGPGPVIKDGIEIAGIKLPVSQEDLTGKVRHNDYHYNPNKGLRADFEDNPKDGSYVNNIAVFKGKFADDVTEDEERTVKWSQAPHKKKGDIVNAYMVAIKNGSGATRVRIEVDHPSGYHTLHEGKKGRPAKKGQTWCIAAVRRNTPNGVRLQLYDQNMETGEWDQLIDYEDTKYKIKDYSKHGMEATGRFDDNKGDKNVKIQDAILAELTSQE